jgi:ElaA protein
MQWQYSDFNGLTVFALYEVLRLRQSVFVIEQKCLFLDADGLDPLAVHLMGWKEGKLAVYARILPRGVIR